MAFDSDTRNLLARIVGECRQILVRDVEAQLQSRYGLYPDGRVLAIAQTADEQRAAQELKELLDHLAANEPAQGKKKVENAYSRLVREIGFTLLNRLAALRLGEERGIVVECVGQGMSSAGFQLYDRIANGALGNRYETYRAFLEGLFDELALDLGVLFDRDTPYSHVFPGEAALGEVLERLNDAGLEERDVWRQDETIGWIYQYYNDPDERRAMRKASSAPRNSRELAVRNQFFTPRYVVEFLTDNTLGRLWYEMRRGDTRLVEQCRYLVRRPNEVFLSDEYLDGWSEPIREGIKQVVKGNFDDLPRDVRWDEFQCLALMIDGYEVAELLWGDEWEERARGFFDRYEEEGSWQGNSLELWLSLFFLQRRWRSPSEPPDDETLKLLADLYTAWRQAMLAEQADEDDQDPADRPVYIPVRRPKDPRAIKILDPAGGSGHFSLYAFDLLLTIYEEGWERSNPDKAASLRSTYPTLEELKHALPVLILRDNLHSIDIDPRATQIAALALWLRAQRHYQSLRLLPKERPPITRSNFVTAEPMPGDSRLLQEFLLTLDDETRVQLVEFVFEQMNLAGEAGSLLRIEQELRDEISRVQKQQDPFLTRGEDYWVGVEEPVLFDLQRYVENAVNGSSVRRQLFAEDAAEGFAFIHVLFQRYDVALMNPPFGSGSNTAKYYVDDTYESSKADVGLAFVERGLELCNAEGTVGAITSRVLVGNESLKTWRLSYFIEGNHLRVFADLGYGVLDEAMVEAAAYVTQKQRLNAPAFFIRVLDERDKEKAVSRFFVDHIVNQRTFPFWRNLNVFQDLPAAVLCYWLPDELLRKVLEVGPLTNYGSTAKHGLQTTDDFRFLRLAWEIPNSEIGRERTWVYFAKGGEYRPLWDDLHLVIKWAGDGHELKTYVSDKALRTQGSGGWSRWINSWEYYFSPGLTFPERTTSDFSPRILPSGCIFSATGEAIFFPDKTATLAYLVGAYSRHFKLLVDAYVGSGDSSVPGSAANHYRSGLINSLPAPCVQLRSVSLNEIVEAVNSARSEIALNETSRDFVSNPLNNWSSIGEGASCISEMLLNRWLDFLELSTRVEDEVRDFLGFDTQTEDLVDVVVGPHPTAYPREPSHPLDTKILAKLWSGTESAIISMAAKTQGARRQITKKSFFANRRLELLSHLYELHPAAVFAQLKRSHLVGKERLSEAALDLVSYLLGCAFGRWDIRFATKEKPSPDLPDLFTPLSSCPPGMLTVSEDNLSSIELFSHYPVRVAPNGVMVDDTSLDSTDRHLDDLVTRIHQILELLWPENHDKIESEVSEILRVGRLHDYFRAKTTGFFSHHIQRYSRSRRKAPIYWPLATTSGSYTLWIYYHRLTEETLYTSVNNYVEPKIQQLEGRLAGLERDLAQAFGREATAVRDEIDGIWAFLAELREFRDELLRVAALPYKPNLNDGVIINAAPLHKLFPHRGWQKDTEKVWQALEAGEYDWSHMAYNIWPERVHEACRRDKSIAIAHGLEELYEEEAQKEGKRNRAGGQLGLDLE